MASELQKRLQEGIDLHNKGQFAEAEEIYRELIAAKFRRGDVTHFLGVLRVQRGAPEEGLALLQDAVKAKPRAAQVHSHLGSAYLRLHRNREAIRHYRQATVLNPRAADAHSNLGNAFLEVGEYSRAEKCFKKAIALQPGLVVAHFNLSLAWLELGRLQDSIKACSAALRLNKNFAKARTQRVFLAMRTCDWPVVEGMEVEKRVAEGESIILPLAFLALSDDPDLQRKAAERYLEDIGAGALKAMPARGGSREQGERMRIGYLSADFHEHAVMQLCVGMFECHDRKEFEVHALSIGPEKEGPMRERLEAAFEQFHELRALGDEQIAERIRELGIDVLVDLAGLTSNHRLGVMARRPAPVQVSYLGYPATTGSSFHDYFLGDAVTVPEGAEEGFSEKVVRLPGCYLATDQKRVIGETPDRAALGLPEDGFVFCSFNGAQKITRPVFEIWMRGLEAVPGSVLWLLADNEVAERNLRSAAEERGVDPERLVLAPRVSPSEHLGRLRQADLLVDTFPYTSHTTMVDALWAGVPGVTCMGRSFASRVAGSLLQAVGLPELVAEDLESFERLALELAGDRERLGGIRKKLADTVASSRLFDTPAFTKEMEEAYRTMAGEG